MRSYTLPPRLECIAEQVEKGARLADVGTDHAYLPVWLLLNGVVDGAIASDVREGPLARAQKNAERYRVEDRLSLRLCDGLAGISPDEVDTVVAAGMGGETISAILDAAAWTADGAHTLLLQPMTAQEQLRSWLSGHRYRICRERLVREGRNLYLVLTVRGGEAPPLSEAECWAGRQERGMVAPLRSAYLEKVLHRLQRASAGAANSGRPEDLSRAEALDAAAREVLRMKEEWDIWQR